MLAVANGMAFAQTPAVFPAGANGQINFVMPSKTIECTFTPKGGAPVYKPFDGGPELSCDRSESKYVRVVLTPKNVRRFNNVGDPSCCGADNVFAHGLGWSHGPFTCDSAAAGVTCKRADGKGFFMGAKDIKLQ
ncbi:MAG: hypothetical protein EXQ82_00520 [Pseudolabrys sp.]|nr:hypothetical protein [Pseudolabrys sp.]